MPSDTELALPLTGQVAHVTGGASGLGAAIATRMQADGATVTISDLDDARGRSLADERGWGFYHHDVRDEQSWETLFAAVERDQGQLNILVNNAGIIGLGGPVSPEDTTLAEWRAIFAVNVEGVFLGCRAAIAAMRQRGGGSIINISSVAGLVATPHATAYGASKATVRHLTKSVAQHCAAERLNIRCNSIHPGNVYTPLWEKLAARDAERLGIPTSDLIDRIGAATPLGGWTQPEDIAAMAAYLASPAARHITGTEMIVDGGIANLDTYHLLAALEGA